MAICAAVSVAAVVVVFVPGHGAGDNAGRQGIASASAHPAVWPGYSNTGVPASDMSHLTPSATITVTQPGAVINGLDVHGCILVRANNVTIENTRVTGSCQASRLNIDTGSEDFTGILIKDVEIDGMDSRAGAGVGYSGYTCLRCNVHRVGQGLVATHNVTIQDSWVHDLYYSDGQHIEAVLSNGGSKILLLHNSLDAPPSAGTTAAVSLFGDFATISDVMVKDNLLNAGGGYCLYAGSQRGKAYPNASDITVSGNTFGTKYNPKCGYAGPVADWAPGQGNTWSNNVWEGTGLQVVP